jgi:hypothetical protein
VSGDNALSAVGEADGVGARGGSLVADLCPRVTMAHKRSSEQRRSFDGYPDMATTVSGAEQRGRGAKSESGAAR